MTTRWLGWRCDLALDLRSLAAFRILLGSFVLWDVYSRMSLGKYDVAWYTSTENNTSYLSPDDSPHGSPLHQFWFYRGSATVQYTLSAFTCLTALCFLLGYQCRRGWLKFALFLLVTAQQNRNMHLHDGSDTFCRHLLLWSCFLPLSEQWSVDAGAGTAASSTMTNGVERNRNDRRGYNAMVTTTISTLPAYAICVQIVLMYWGTVAGRTIDLYTIKEMWRSDWLPPHLPAVHYALSGSFAVRDIFLNDFIRSHSTVSKAMTFSAMLVEAFAAPLCFLLGHHRHISACVLLLLHGGLMVTLHLPHWQLLAMLTQVLWIPSHAWNRILRLPTPVDLYKKTDNFTGMKVASRTQAKSGRLSRYLQRFFFGYMIYNWCGERDWIRKHDNGDIGEGLRLSQHWVMYSKVSRMAHNTIVTGWFEDGGSMDILHYIQTKSVVPAVSDHVVLQDMSNRYPSARWERALSTWASTTYNPSSRNWIRSERFCRTLCVLLKQDGGGGDLGTPPPLQEIEMRVQHVGIRPLEDSGLRFFEYKGDDDVSIRVRC